MHKTHKQNINKQLYFKQNINKQLYLNSDYVLYIASKQLRDYGYCFAIIDLKARHIISHFYKATPPNLADMIDCLSLVIKETSFLPNVKFINSNPESLNQYFDKLNVKSATGTLNQIVQRTFRTLTHIIKKQLQDNIETALHEAIKIYNNKPHKALDGMTPNQMRQLLFPIESNNNADLKDNQLFPIESIHDNKGTAHGREENCKINEYRLQVSQHYAGDWQQFFIDFRNDNNNKFNELLTQNKMLYEQNIELQNNSTFMTEEIAIMRKQRLESEQRKQKRQNAKKQELRASITPDEFHFILASGKCEGFVPAGKRAAFLLLYYTGLRVSNLLNLFVNHMKDLLDKGKTYLSLNKGGASRHPISLSLIARKRIHNHLTDFHELMRDKAGNPPFFTTQNLFCYYNKRDILFHILIIYIL